MTAIGSKLSDCARWTKNRSRARRRWLMDKQQPAPVPASTPLPLVVEEASATPDEIRHADGRIEHPRASHESTDIIFLGIAVTVVVIGVALAAVIGAVG